MEGVVDGSSSIWYSDNPDLEGLSTWKIPILLGLASVWRVFYYEGNLSKSMGTPPQKLEQSWQGNPQYITK
jgi:hypothetical protein